MDKIIKIFLYICLLISMCTPVRYMILENGDEKFVTNMGYKIVKVEQLRRGVIKVYYK